MDKSELVQLIMSLPFFGTFFKQEIILTMQFERSFRLVSPLEFIDLLASPINLQMQLKAVGLIFISTTSSNSLVI